LTSSAFAWPVRLERKRFGSVSVIRRASGPRTAGMVIAQEALMPLQSSRRLTAQSGTSWSATTSGASAVTRRTICSRRSVSDCGWLLPWYRFQLRTRSFMGGLV